MIGIYKITNLINNQCYIGKSENIEKRWSRHLSVWSNLNDKAYNYPLYKAIRQYGLEKFKWEVLEQCSKEKLNEREKYWIAFYDSYKNGYNQTEGGDTFPEHGRFSKLTDSQVKEIKQKLSSQQYTLKKLSEEYNVHKDTIRDINNGWTWVDEKLKYPLYISYKSPFYERKNNRQIIVKREKKKNYCIDCGKEISNQAIRCVDCYKKTTKSFLMPNKEELQQMLIESKGNFTEIGKKYGITDNTVRKWCKKYDIPFHSKDYKPIIEKPKRTTPEKCKVNQYDLNNNFIQSFESYASAARWLEDNGYVNGNLNGVRSKIGEVCKGKRKTAYKFIWRDAE